MAASRSRWRSLVHLWWAAPLGTYLALFAFFGFRRWGCSLPWTRACMVEFSHTLEASVLFLWVRDRETIFAALLAIAAAGAGLWLTWYIDQQNRGRRFDAALGRLVHTCSNLTRYLRAAADVLIPVYDARDGERIPRGTNVGDLPQYPAAALSDLAAVIDAADPQTSAYVRRFLGELQVQSARLTDLPRELNQPGLSVAVINIETLIIDIVELDALLEPLYRLARGELRTIDVGPTAEIVANSMNVLGFRDDRFQRARTSILKRYGDVAIRDVV